MAPTDKVSRVPEGLYIKCPGCTQVIYNKDLAANLGVCPRCAFHFKMTASERLAMLFDGDYTTYDGGLVSTDPLDFTDTKPYKARLKSSIAATGMNDAVVTATGLLDGIETVIAAMDFAFIGGSMGLVVGEKMTRAIERALASRAPLVIVSCSGGARMKEGALSLMQMAKTSAALARMAAPGCPSSPCSPTRPRAA